MIAEAAYSSAARFHKGKGITRGTQHWLAAQAMCCAKSCFSVKLDHSIPRGEAARCALPDTMKGLSAAARVYSMTLLGAASATSEELAPNLPELPGATSVVETPEQPSLAARRLSETVWYQAVDGCSSDGTQSSTCSESSSLAAIRCCNEAADSCFASVCSESVGSWNFLEPISGSFDGTAVTYQQAAGECEARGKRLCTADELGRQVCCGTGCGYDASLVWSGTSCTAPIRLGSPSPMPPPALPPPSPPLPEPPMAPWPATSMLVSGSVPGLAPSSKYACRVRQIGGPWEEAFVFYSESLEDITETGQKQSGYFNNLQGWSNNWVSFEVGPETTVEVEITMLFGSGTITAAVPRPASRGSAAFLDGKAVITVTGAQQLTVDINGALEQTDTAMQDIYPSRVYQVHSFHIFANPLLSDAERPDPASADVRTVSPGETPPTDFAESTLYFLPGVHQLGANPACCSTAVVADACACTILDASDPGYAAPFTLQTGKSYYLPSDAYLNGYLMGDAIQHVKLFGYGVVSGESFRWRGESAYNAPSALKLRWFANVTIHGPCFVDFPTHHVILVGDTEHSWGRVQTPNTLNHVKILGWRVNGDGVHMWGRWNPVTDLFLRTSDDSLYLGDEFVSTVYRRITTWNDANGVPFIFGWGDGGPTLLEDSDVLYIRRRWPWWCGGVFDMRQWISQENQGHNVTIRNVRVTDPFPTCPLLDLRGSRKNLFFENVSMDRFSTFRELPGWACSLSYESDAWRFYLPSEIGCELPFGIPMRVMTKFYDAEWNHFSDGTDPNANITNLIFDNVKINGTDLHLLMTATEYAGAFLAQGQLFDVVVNGQPFTLPPPPSTPPLPPALPSPPAPPGPPVCTLLDDRTLVSVAGLSCEDLSPLECESSYTLDAGAAAVLNRCYLDSSGSCQGAARTCDWQCASCDTWGTGTGLSEAYDCCSWVASRWGELYAASALPLSCDFWRAKMMQGHFRVGGSCGINSGAGSTCPDDAGLAAIRCCETAADTCSASVCSESVGSWNFLEPISGSFDGTAVTYQQAAGECEARGKRLCTKAELERGVCCGTGCGYDASLVWSSTSCSPPPPSQSCTDITTQDTCQNSYSSRVTTVGADSHYTLALCKWSGSACSEDPSSATNVTSCVLNLSDELDDEEASWWGAWGQGAGAMGGGFAAFFIGLFATARWCGRRTAIIDPRKSGGGNITMAARKSATQLEDHHIEVEAVDMSATRACTNDLGASSRESSAPRPSVAEI